MSREIYKSQFGFINFPVGFINIEGDLQTPLWKIKFNNVYSSSFGTNSAPYIILELRNFA